MPIDPHNEKLLTFQELARKLPCRRADRPLHVATIHRWRSRGLNGIRLEAIRVGGAWHTSPDAFTRFCISEAISTSGPIVIVEGVTDVWKLKHNAVALFGKTASREQLAILTRFFSQREVIVMLDKDAESEAYQLKNEIMKIRNRYKNQIPVSVVQIPDHANDVGELSCEDAWDVIGQVAISSAGTCEELTTSPPSLPGNRELHITPTPDTGRWTAPGGQLHGLPRPQHEINDPEPLIQAISDTAQFQQNLPEDVAPGEALRSLIRPCLKAKVNHVLAIADYSSVEARGLAWCAGETSLLEDFHRGEDVYAKFAGLIFGLADVPVEPMKRDVGKIAMLGCGYGMSPGRFAEQCRSQGVDLAANGVSAEQIVDRYRRAHPKITGFQSSCWVRNQEPGL